MSKFLKVGTNGGGAVYLDIAKIETAEFNVGKLLVRINGVIITIDCDNAFGMLEWLDANSESLPGDGAAAENAKDANVRRHFLALVGYCEDWADVCTDDRKFSIYMTMLKILVHSGELPTEVPADEMSRRLDIVLDVCNAGLDDKTNMPHIRDIYQNIMNLADIGAELPEGGN